MEKDFDTKLEIDLTRQFYVDMMNNKIRMEVDYEMCSNRLLSATDKEPSKVAELTQAQSDMRQKLEIIGSGLRILRERLDKLLKDSPDLPLN